MFWLDKRKLFTPMKLLSNTFFIVFLFIQNALFAQEPLYIGVHAGVNQDFFRLKDAAQNMIPYPNRSHSLSLNFRKPIHKYLSLESGMTYKELNGGGINRRRDENYKYFILPLKLNGKISLSKKNDLNLISSIGGFYIFNSLKTNAISSNGWTEPFFNYRDFSYYSFNYNSIFSGNQFGVSGEIALELKVFKKGVLIHVGYQLATAFSNVYRNEFQYTINDQELFVAQINSKHQTGGYNIGFYYPIHASPQK